MTELRHVIAGYAAMRDVDVVHDHTLIGPLYRDGHPVRTGRHHEPRTLRRRAHADLPSHASGRRRRHLPPPASTAVDVPVAAVIHHGLDVEAVPVGRGDGGYASFLGRMCPEKGPRQAVLIARAAGVPLKIAAKIREQAERDYFEHAVEPLLGNDVEYVGELGPEDKLDLVGGSFALLNPMQWPEPFGLVMIEALARYAGGGHPGGLRTGDRR